MVSRYFDILDIERPLFDTYDTFDTFDTSSIEWVNQGMEEGGEGGVAPPGG